LQNDKRLEEIACSLSIGVDRTGIDSHLDGVESRARVCIQAVDEVQLLLELRVGGKQGRSDLKQISACSATHRDGMEVDPFLPFLARIAKRICGIGEYFSDMIGRAGLIRRIGRNGSIQPNKKTGCGLGHGSEGNLADLEVWKSHSLLGFGKLFALSDIKGARGSKFAAARCASEGSADVAIEFVAERADSVTVEAINRVAEARATLCGNIPEGDPGSVPLGEDFRSEADGEAIAKPVPGRFGVAGSPGKFSGEIDFAENYLVETTGFSQFAMDPFLECLGRFGKGLERRFYHGPIKSMLRGSKRTPSCCVLRCDGQGAWGIALFGYTHGRAVAGFWPGGCTSPERDPTRWRHL
jgi:hypothetical protein